MTAPSSAENVGLSPSWTQPDSDFLSKRSRVAPLRTRAEKKEKRESSRHVAQLALYSDAAAPADCSAAKDS